MSETNVDHGTEVIEQPQEQPDATATETEGDYTKREQAHYQEIQELNRKVMKAKGYWEAAKNEANFCKKEYDGLVDRLQATIQAGPDPQGKLPFADEPQQEVWRDVPLSEALALTAKQLERLEGAGVTTMGQLEDLRAGEGIASVKGFGQAAVDKIEDQIIDWLTENRDVEPEPEAEPEEEALA